MSPVSSSSLRVVAFDRYLLLKSHNTKEAYLCGQKGNQTLALA